jgi:hypothetical protein
VPSRDDLAGPASDDDLASGGPIMVESPLAA